MLTLEASHALTRKEIARIVDRLLSGQFELDGYCRLLALIKDPNTPDDVRDGLIRASNWMRPLNDVGRAVMELRKHL